MQERVRFFGIPSALRKAQACGSFFGEQIIRPVEDFMPTTEQLGLSTIGQIALSVRDLATSVDFYRDTLGMRFLFQAPPGLAFFDCGGVRLMLSRPESAEFDRPGSVLYYKVPDIQ